MNTRRHSIITKTIPVNDEADETHGGPGVGVVGAGVGVGRVAPGTLKAVSTLPTPSAPGVARPFPELMTIYCSPPVIYVDGVATVSQCKGM